MKQVTFYDDKIVNTGNQGSLNFLWLYYKYSVSYFWICFLIGLPSFRLLPPKKFENQYVRVVDQNQDLKNEAKILSSNLKEVRKTLTIVEDYSNKINDFTKLRARSIKKKLVLVP